MGAPPFYLGNKNPRIERGNRHSVGHGQFEVIRIAGHRIHPGGQALFNAQIIGGKSVISEAGAVENTVIPVVLPVRQVVHAVNLNGRGRIG